MTKDTIIDIYVEANNTVEDVQNILTVYFDSQTVYQKIYFNGRHLYENEILGKIGIKSGDTVVCILKNI